MKKILTAAILLLTVAGAFAQLPDRHDPKAAEERAAKMKEEAAAYYANADTALFGVRYRFKYLYNKEKKLWYDEDRMVLVRPEVTLDMSYEGLGENRWAASGQKGGDPTLAYHLTPDYYFYYPESRRAVKTYRMIAEEFLLSDTVCDNKWNITDQTMQFGKYMGRKATMEKGGRKWEAWFTNDLPYVAAPAGFNGLPGVLLGVADDDEEVIWVFQGLIENLPDSKLYIKFPDKLRQMPADKFRKALRIVARSDGNHLRTSGVWDMNPSSYPSKLRPETGIDALEIDNPIER